MSSSGVEKSASNLQWPLWRSGEDNCENSGEDNPLSSGNGGEVEKRQLWK